EAVESKEARRDLVNLALTSTDFFYPCMEAAWAVIFNVKHLLAVLHARVLSDGGEGSSASTSMSIAELHNDQVFKHFRYYAARITHLKVLAHDHPPATLALARSFLPPGICHIFPKLKQLVWLEGETCLLRGDIATFLEQSPAIESVALRFDHHQHLFPGDITLEHRSFCRDAVIQLCDTVSSMRPKLKYLILDVPTHIPVPSAILTNFDDLRCVELQMCISNSPPSEGAMLINRPQLRTLERLELLWTVDSNIRSLPQDVSFSNVQYLAVRSMEHEPCQTFISDVNLLTTLTTANLTMVEIFFLNLGGPSLYNGSFMEFISPLTDRSSLRHVSIVLTGHRFDFTAHDLQTLTHGWPALQSLNLSFEATPVQHGAIPDLQDTIPRIPSQCPGLTFLHLPVIGSFIGQPEEAAFTMHPVSQNCLRHLSSDVLTVQHGILDIAFGLRWAFPDLSQFGPPGKHTVWCEIQNLVCALQTKDFPVIFEHTARRMRDNTYPGIP
ncbi:hypothetical protein C2E23DRAFT_720106, partial [Lenzites betulinus]